MPQYFDGMFSLAKRVRSAGPAERQASGGFVHMHNKVRKAHAELTLCIIHMVLCCSELYVGTEPKGFRRRGRRHP